MAALASKGQAEMLLLLIRIYSTRVYKYIMQFYMSDYKDLLLFDL